MTDIRGENKPTPTYYQDDRTKHPYVKPRDAATLIIVDRSHTKPRVLLGKRHGKVAFMPNALVFPGGRVDPTDSAVPVAANIPSALEARLMEGTPKTSPARARALAVAAIREVYEETGLCLGKKVDGHLPSLPSAWQAFAEAGLLPDPSSLFLVARAITPTGRIKRYDTRFFAADISAVTHRVPGIVHADAELVELAWVDIDGAPLSSMHWITVRVLDHLKSQIEAGPLRHDSPVPFFRRQNGRRASTISSETRENSGNP